MYLYHMFQTEGTMGDKPSHISTDFQPINTNPYPRQSGDDRVEPFMFQLNHPPSKRHVNVGVVYSTTSGPVSAPAREETRKQQTWRCKIQHYACAINANKWNCWMTACKYKTREQLQRLRTIISRIVLLVPTVLTLNTHLVERHACTCKSVKTVSGVIAETFRVNSCHWQMKCTGNQSARTRTWGIYISILRGGWGTGRSGARRSSVSDQRHYVVIYRRYTTNCSFRRNYHVWF